MTSEVPGKPLNVFSRRRKRSSFNASTSEVQVKPFNVFYQRRKRSSFNASGDSEFVLPGVPKDEMSKHRSCVVHTLTYKHGEQATREQAKDIEDEYGTARCFFKGILRGKRSRKSKRADSVPFRAIGITSDPVPSQGKDMSADPVPIVAPDTSQATKTSSVPIPSQAKNMSSSSFAEHLERMLKSFPTDKLAQFTFIECLLFAMYQKASDKTKVLSWINKQNIFSTDYVFIPICIWSHWNLLILCHFSERLNSKSKKPCMLLLDSLHMAGPKRLEIEIRKFVLDIYKMKGISGQRVSKIPLLVPKVPQQKHKECGYFALYFIKKFMEAEKISDGDLSFMDKDWFTREELDGFCIELEEESKLHREIEASKLQRELEASAFEKKGRESREGDVIVLHED